MVKVSHYIADKQLVKLKDLSENKNLSVGALIRLAINDLIKKLSRSENG